MYRPFQVTAAIPRTSFWLKLPLWFWMDRCSALGVMCDGGGKNEALQKLHSNSPVICTDDYKLTHRVSIFSTSIVITDHCVISAYLR
jgi:hypothetical protein